MKQAGVYKKGELSFNDVLDDLRSAADPTQVGAIGAFIGVVRGKSLEGHGVTRLDIEAYEEKAEMMLSKICSDLMKKEDIADVRIYHNLGEFKPGEELVYVVVSGGHRKNVFEALKEAVERYKHEAPFFKREHIIDKDTGKTETRWVEDNVLK